jgi:hypothetical protein
MSRSQCCGGCCGGSVGCVLHGAKYTRHESISTDCIVSYEYRIDRVGSRVRGHVCFKSGNNCGYRGSVQSVGVDGVVSQITYGNSGWYLLIRGVPGSLLEFTSPGVNLELGNCVIPDTTLDCREVPANRDLSTLARISDHDSTRPVDDRLVRRGH